MEELTAIQPSFTPKPPVLKPSMTARSASSEKTCPQAGLAASNKMKLVKMTVTFTLLLFLLVFITIPPDYSQMELSLP